MTEKELRQAVVDKAASFIGSKKGSSNHKMFLQTYNNFVKTTNTRINGYPRTSQMADSYAWCACFASSIAIMMGYGMKIIPVEMSCCKMISMWTKMGRWMENDNYTPQPGDYIYFDWDGSIYTDSVGVQVTDHVGIVEKVEGNIIHTIEGNVTVNGYSQVARKQRTLKGANISGFGLPDYASLADSKEQPIIEETKPVVNTTPTNKLTFAIGDEVKLTSDAKWQSGSSIPTWVKNSKLYVRSIGTNTITISIYKTGAITGTVRDVYVKFYDESKNNVTNSASSTTIKLDSASKKDVSLAGSYKTTASVNLHAGAASTKPLITILPAGTSVVNYGYYNLNGSTKWLCVITSYNGKSYTGFISINYLKKQ